MREWKVGRTSYCRERVNVSSRLNQAGARRIINSRHRGAAKCLSIRSRGRPRLARSARLAGRRFMRKNCTGRRRKMRAQEAEGGEFAVLFIRSSRFLAKSRRSRSELSVSFYGRLAFRARRISWKLIVKLWARFLDRACRSVSGLLI